MLLFFFFFLSPIEGFKSCIWGSLQSVSGILPFSEAIPFLGSGRELTAIRWGDKWLPSRLSVQLIVGVVKVDTRSWWSKHTVCPYMQARVDCLPSLWSANIGSLECLRNAPNGCNWSLCERKITLIILRREWFKKYNLIKHYYINIIRFYL